MRQTHIRFLKILRSRFSKELQKPIALACSGGMDSMVLLDLLREYKNRHQKDLDILVCHIDHNQRSDSHLDLKCIAEYCKKHGLPLVHKKLALKKESSENILRKARYMALAELSQNRPIFLAHHAQDQLETYLFRVLRGTHPDSLKAMEYKKIRTLENDEKIILLRPLLDFSKTELIEYKRKADIQSTNDSTNTDLKFMRNRIRLELLPLLEKLRPNCAEHLLDFFNAVKETAPKQKTVGEKIPNAGLLTKAIKFEVLKKTVDELLKENSQQTTKAHWQTLSRILKERQKTKSGGGPQKIIQFPGSYFLLFKNDRIYWVNKEAKKVS